MKTTFIFMLCFFLLQTSLISAQYKRAAQLDEAAIANSKKDCLPCIAGQIPDKCFDYCARLSIANSSVTALKKDVERLMTDYDIDRREINSDRMAKTIHTVFEDSGKTSSAYAKLSAKEKLVLESLINEKKMNMMEITTVPTKGK